MVLNIHYIHANILNIYILLDKFYPLPLRNNLHINHILHHIRKIGSIPLSLLAIIFAFKIDSKGIV